MMNRILLASLPLFFAACQNTGNDMYSSGSDDAAQKKQAAEEIRKGVHPEALGEATNNHTSNLSEAGNQASQLDPTGVQIRDANAEVQDKTQEQYERLLRDLGGAEVPSVNTDAAEAGLAESLTETVATEMGLDATTVEALGGGVGGAIDTVEASANELLASAKENISEVAAEGMVSAEERIAAIESAGADRMTEVEDTTGSVNVNQAPEEVLTGIVPSIRKQGGTESGDHNKANGKVEVGSLAASLKADAKTAAENASASLEDASAKSATKLAELDLEEEAANATEEADALLRSNPNKVNLKGSGLGSTPAISAAGVEASRPANSVDPTNGLTSGIEAESNASARALEEAIAEAQLKADAERSAAEATAKTSQESQTKNLTGQLESAATLEASAPSPDDLTAIASMEDRMRELATPGPEHEVLNDLVGQFDARVSYWLMPDTEAIPSSGVMSSSWALGGRFLQGNYEGSMLGEPFYGFSHLGYDKVRKQYVGYWVDTMGTQMMNIASGSLSKDGKAITLVRNTPDALTGKVLEMKEILTMVDKDNHTWEMWGFAPDGTYYRMVHVHYSRKQ